MPVTRKETERTRLEKILSFALSEQQDKKEPKEEKNKNHKNEGSFS